jgi:hypothetical protein
MFWSECHAYRDAGSRMHDRFWLCETWLEIGVLGEGSATTRSGTRCTAETVVSGGDGVVREYAEVVDIKNRSRRSWRDDLECLIEVAIIDRTVVSDADEVATHQVRDCGRVEIVD